MFLVVIFLLSLVVVVAAHSIPATASHLQERDTCIGASGPTNFCAVYGASHLTTFKHNINPTDLYSFNDQDSVQVTGLNTTGQGIRYTLFTGQAYTSTFSVAFETSAGKTTGVTGIRKIIVNQTDAVTGAIQHVITFSIPTADPAAALVSVESLAPWQASGTTKDAKFSYYNLMASNVVVGTFGVGVNPHGDGLLFGMKVSAGMFPGQRSGACTRDLGKGGGRFDASPESFPEGQ